MNRINESDALQLLNNYKIHPDRIAHSVGVSDFAFKIAQQINQLHPELDIDPQKVKLAALLHDIGRSQPGDHELNTISILKQEGLEEIASITMHGSFYEIMKLRGEDNPSYLPKTIENKIVAYADARFKDKLLSLEERWSEIEHRRSNEPEKLRSITMAKQR
ncbi:MAG: HD domain-containing protein, partial [Fibrobacter sp.]|nr:HD domain-containing protein [Fibrobacter sp.]